MYKDYKAGDKVRVLEVDFIDEIKGIKTGDIFTVIRKGKYNHIVVKLKDGTDDSLYTDQIELVKLSQPTHFNFISKTQIAEHLQKVITFYEDYTSDLLKETARDYKKNAIDLKETGYEYRLELDKILIQVEE